MNDDKWLKYLIKLGVLFMLVITIVLILALGGQYGY